MGFGVEENKEKNSLVDYFDNLAKPKQNLGVAGPGYEMPEPEHDLDNYPPQITPEDLKHKQIALEASQFTANIVVETIDVAFSEIGGLIAKLDTEDKRKLKADEDTKPILVDAWANYLKDKGGELSPGVLLIILVLGVYAPKIPLIFEMRKLQKANADLSGELEAKEMEIAKLKQQIKKDKKKPAA